MVSDRMQVVNPTGLHFRPAGSVCEKALQFTSKIEMKLGNGSYNMKSLLSVLSAKIAGPAEIEVICTGEDEREALEAMRELLQVSFDDSLKPMHG